jgi:ABC-type branched-subunit amino acid transport system substrate-binding protein
MVNEYVAKYGGTASGVNADVAEAYSVGEVTAQAVEATHSLSGPKLIAYLHSGVTLTSVEGPVSFNSIGENVKAIAFIFQWQNGKFVQVLPTTATGSVPILYPKTNWSS